MAQEIEVKFTYAPEHSDALLRALLALPGAQDAGQTRMHNRYFDTPDGRLNRERMALRLRDAGGKPLQTLKTKGVMQGGVARRGEWEWPLQEYALDLALLADTPLAEYDILDQLEVCFDTVFTRHAVDVRSENTEVEAVLDAGYIEAGDQRQSLCELELELYQGGPHRLQELALELGTEVPLFLNTISKAEQGYWLAGLYQPPWREEDHPVDDWLGNLSVLWLRNDPTQWNQAIQSHRQVEGMAGEAGRHMDWERVLNSFETAQSRALPPREVLQSMPRLTSLQLDLMLMQ